MKRQQQLSNLFAFVWRKSEVPWNMRIIKNIILTTIQSCHFTSMSKKVKSTWFYTYILWTMKCHSICVIWNIVLYFIYEHVHKSDAWSKINTIKRNKEIKKNIVVFLLYNQCYIYLMIMWSQHVSWPPASLAQPDCGLSLLPWSKHSPGGSCQPLVFGFPAWWALVSAPQLLPP